MAPTSRGSCKRPSSRRAPGLCSWDGRGMARLVRQVGGFSRLGTQRAGARVQGSAAGRPSMERRERRVGPRSAGDRSQRLGSDFQRQGGQMSGQQIKERSPRLSLGRPLKLGSFFHLLFPPFPPPNDPCFLSCPIYFAPAWPQRSRVGSVCPWRDPSRGHWRRLVRRPRLCPPPGTPAPRGAGRRCLPPLAPRLN